jgi:hypothetical protein
VSIAVIRWPGHFVQTVGRQRPFHEQSLGQLPFSIGFGPAHSCRYCQNRKRPAHPSPFSPGSGRRRAGRGSMAEPRFGPCILIAVAETRPSGGQRGRGRDEAATQVRGRTTGLSVRWPCRRFGRSLDETATPQPTGGAQGYGRA